MFQQASVRTAFRAAVVITETTTLALTSASGFMPSKAGFVCFNVTDYTTGSVTVTFQGSLDGTTWYELPSSLGVVLSADGLTIVDLASQNLPRYVRATLTYASSFDGTLEVWTQTTADVT